MEKALGLLSSETSVALEADPRLKLLLELEPAGKVFFSNLADAVLFRKPPHVETTSRPGEFWDDVFVPTEMPWRSFQESMLWHLVVMFAAWALTQAWVSRPHPRVNQSYRASRSLYYTPSKTYPSSRSRAAVSAHNESRGGSASRGPKPMPVAAEHRGTPALVVPPDLKLAEGNRAPNLNGTVAMPAVPLSATDRTDRAPMGGLGSVVAPPPEVGGRANRLGGLPQSAVVAPPADVAAMGGRRSLRGPGSSVIEPPPQLSSQGLGGPGARSMGGVGAAIVPPPPSVEHSGRAGSVSGPGVAVVPPPPSVQGAGTLGGSAGGKGLGSLGPQVVPPPPAVQGGGGVLAAISSFLSGAASKIVPPPPGLQGAEGGSGGSSRAGSLAGGGSQVVPPPPSVQGGGSGSGRITSLSSGGSEIVPPPPTTQGAGGTSARGGLGGSLAGGGSSVVPPPPSVSGTGSGRGVGSGSRGGGSLSAGGADVVPPPPSLGGSTGAGGNGGGRLGSLPGGGTQVVPPPPNLQGTGSGNGSGNGNGNGTGSGRRGGPLMAGGGNVVGPPPSLAGEGGSGAGGRAGGLGGGGLGASPPAGAGSVSTGPLEPMDPLPDVPQTAQPAPTLPQNPAAPGEDVPVRLIPVPGASSRSSFFSSYEVVLAERNINQTQKELIKLVYVSLPYQKRLAEYDWSTTKIYKLRVTQDPTCDESLMQMMWPEGEDQPDAEALAAASKLASDVSDKNTKLKCYRTTADDFARAMSHHQ